MLNSYFSIPKIDEDLLSRLSNQDERMLSITRLSKGSEEINLSDYDLVMFGVAEERNAASNKGSNKAPDAIRNELYQLYKPFDHIKVVDLGNLNLGETVKDTYAGVKFVVDEILSVGSIPIIIGGSQDLSVPVYEATEKHKKSINLTLVDSRFDIGGGDELFDSETFLNRIIFEESKKLFNVTILGYQTYYVSPKDIELMGKMFFETVRLGQARTDVSDTEPILRDTDILSIDINSVKHVDAPGHEKAPVHGFYGEEMCQMAFYTGINDRQTTLGLFEVNPSFDLHNKTASLSAQIIWHFIQGFCLRRNDLPTSKVKKLIVAQTNYEHDIIFYKSMVSERWWLEVPCSNQPNKKKIVSCSRKDYDLATQQDIPDRWWKVFHKIN